MEVFRKFDGRRDDLNLWGIVFWDRLDPCPRKRWIMDSFGMAPGYC